MMKCMVCDRDMVDTLDNCPHCQIKQLQAELDVIKEDLAIMTGNYQTHAGIAGQLRAENKSHIKTINTLIENIDDGTDEVIKQLQAKLGIINKIATKHAQATEYYEDLIENKFIKMPFLAQKLVNQMGEEILQALKEE